MKAATDTTIHADDYYEGFLARFQRAFSDRLARGGPIFTTDAADLWPRYLSGLPADCVQHYTCNACRGFIERYGGLVVMDDSFGLVPLCWWVGDDGGQQEHALALLAGAVVRASVTGVWYASEPVWGWPEKGGWRHMHLMPPASRIWTNRLKTAGQAMAEKREDYATLSRALASVTPDQLGDVVALLESETLYRAEHVLGPARWLRDLKRDLAATKHHEVKRNRVWHAVATAPPGYCHPHTTMVGTLIEDVAAGLAFAACAGRFASKMHPLQYQRPRAPPSVGNLERAEIIAQKLGIERSLERRFARIDEVEAIWKPTPPAEPERQQRTGVFGHLAPATPGERREPLVPPPIPMTIARLRAEVLPVAVELELYLPSAQLSLGALTTAVHADAPPILQWDDETARNPMAWYVYSGGSTPQRWSLTPGWTRVTAVCLGPHQWGTPHDRCKHHGRRLMFILDGARDAATHQELALFPETLRAELREVRSTIEAFSKAGQLQGGDEASACGLILAESWEPSVIRLRATIEGRVRHFHLDRWE